LAIQACNQLQLPLVIIGCGRDENRLRRLAGPTIRFMGRLPDQDVINYYAKCQALILPGEEDFGITPLEAQASGRPVIAYAAGGSLASVIDNVTGTFFYKQTIESLVEVLASFDEQRYDPQTIYNHALEFDQPRFKRRIQQFIEAKMSEGKTRDIHTPSSELIL
jgi:glycosyltransferase involved in cell wall biosynthesis